MIKRWLLIGAGIAAGLGVLVRVITSPAVATPPKPFPSPVIAPKFATGANRWRVAWTVPTPDVSDVSLSTDGQNVAWTDSKGCVRRLRSDSGRMLWRTAPLSGVNHVVAAPDGSVAAYSRLNPDRNSVVLLHPLHGELKSRIFAGDGAVWSAAFDMNSVAFIGTGGRMVYEVRNPSREKSPVLTDGVPESLVVASDASRIALGTWSRAGVLSCSLAGKQPCWRRVEPDADRACRVAVSADGSRVLVLSIRGANETEGMVRVHDGKTGALLWEVRLPEGASQPTALLSASGEYVAVTYRRSAAVANSDDWRLAYFDAEGNRLFSDKGSALFRPIIAAVAADGATITVRNADDTLFTLDRRGNFVAKMRLSDEKTLKPFVIKDISSSLDGRTLLLERRDGQLTLLRNGA
ncbi:MAG: PQQ-binding-like beta-propeller repeat protein [Fibrella sp.]|nr:PQQ-binding-like beta-propeller repeat protein [Armatimonadota bacterium]